jgi:hypothetical protein
MARWSDLEREAPDLARDGRALLYQFGPGLAYLATKRADGGLRIHPFCSVVTGGGIYGLIGDSPKRNDLAANGTFAIHAFPKAESDDEFMLAGQQVRKLTDPAEIAAVAEVYHASGATSSGEEWTFEFLFDRALLSLYELRDSGEPTWPPRYFRWQAK